MIEAQQSDKMSVIKNPTIADLTESLSHEVILYKTILDEYGNLYWPLKWF